MRKVMMIALCLAAMTATGCVFALGNRGETPAKCIETSNEKDLILKKDGGGIVLRTEAGKSYRVTVGDDGQLKTAPIS